MAFFVATGAAHADAKRSRFRVGVDAQLEPEIRGQVIECCDAESGGRVDFHPRGVAGNAVGERCEGERDFFSHRWTQLRGKGRAECAVGLLDDLAHHQIAGVTTAGPRHESRAESAVAGERRGLQYARLRAVEGLVFWREPRPERAARHAVAGDAVVAENEVVPALPLEPIRALRLVGEARDERRFALLPRAQVGRDELREAAAAAGHRRVEQLGGDEHVEKFRRRIAEDHGIARGRPLVGRGERRGPRGFFKMNAVRAAHFREPRGRAVDCAHGVEAMHRALVRKGRAGTDRALILIGDRDGERMMRPRDEIGAGNVRPLMRAEAPFARVAVAVDEVEKMEAARVEEGHAIADAGVQAARFPILRDGPFGSEDLALAPRHGFRAAARVAHFIGPQCAIPQREFFDLARGDQRLAASLRDCADRPFFIHKHAIDEQLQHRSREVHHHFVRRCRTDGR